MANFILFTALLLTASAAHAELRTLGFTATLDGHEGAQFSETLREAAKLPKGEIKFKGFDCHASLDLSPGGCSGWLVNENGDIKQIVIKGQSQVSELLKTSKTLVYKDPQNGLKPEQGDLVVVKEITCSAHVEECQIVFTAGGGAMGADLQ